MRYYYYKLGQIEEKIASYKNSKIFFYPAGNISKKLLENINTSGMDIGLIDCYEISCLGYTVYKNDILKTYKNAVVFITSSKYEQSIRDDIKEIKEFEGVIETAFMEEEETDISDKNSILSLPRMDLVLTTRCSLRCEKCANLMQYYENPTDVKLDIILQSMRTLMQAIDSIETIYVLGGEPFLYKDLDRVLSYLNKEEKIKIIKIVTNGTICPLDDNIRLWEELHQSKVIISLSDYGVLSKNKEKLFQQCKKKYINIEIEENKFFYDTGNMEKRYRTEKELQKVFTDCKTLCRSLFNGEFHYCPRSSHGTDLGIVPKYKGEYINLLNVENEFELRKEIEEFINREDYIEVCDYCDIRVPGYYEKIYPAAVQTPTVLYVEV